MGGEELKWRHLAHHQLMSQQGPHLSPHSTVKTNDKSTFLMKDVSSGMNDVVIASVYSGKTCLKKLMMMMMMKMMMMMIIIIVTQKLFTSK